MGGVGWAEREVVRVCREMRGRFGGWVGDARRLRSGVGWRGLIERRAGGLWRFESKRLERGPRWM